MIRIVSHDRLSLLMSMVEQHVAKPLSSSKSRPTLEDRHMLAITLLAKKKHAGEPVPDHAPPELQHKAGKDARMLWECTKMAAELAMARADGNSARARQLSDELKYSECDVCWVDVVEHYEEYFGLDGRKNPIPYVRYANLDDFVYDALAPDATVALLGDWGTGMDPAVELMDQIAAHQPDALIHLGDIYYSGTDTETMSHFLDVINRHLDRSRTKVYTIPGNHDMYSGGAGFYSLIRRLNPDRPQEASFFSLRTTDGAWQFLAMDTGLHDHDPYEVSSGMTFLEPDELVWHIDKIERQHAGGGKTILISHHQLFSAFSTIGSSVYRPPEQQAFNTNLLDAFRSSLGAGKVTAWFWGHEHNLAIYEPYPPLDKGRCIGHGALPVWADDEPYKPRSGLTNPPALVKGPQGNAIKLTLNDDGVYDTGFALVHLQGASADVCYYVRSKPGEPIYRETLT